MLKKEVSFLFLVVLLLGCGEVAVIDVSVEGTDPNVSVLAIQLLGVGAESYSAVFERDDGGMQLSTIEDVSPGIYKVQIRGFSGYGVILHQRIGMLEVERGEEILVDAGAL